MTTGDVATTSNGAVASVPATAGTPNTDAWAARRTSTDVPRADVVASGPRHTPRPFALARMPAATTAATPAALDTTISVETPELVLVSYAVAGLGSRAAAAFLDFLLSACLLLAINLLAIAAAATFPGIGGLRSAAGAWIEAALLLAQFGVLWGYHVAFEVLWDGQTPAKRWLGLRVVRDGGYSVTLAAAALRNLVRVLDAQPLFFYAVGCASALISQRGKRLGDLVAGTLVVQERIPRDRTHVERAPVARPSADRASADRPSAGRPATPRVAPAFQTTLLDDEQYAVLARFIARRADFAPERVASLAQQLATAFAPALDALAREDGRLESIESAQGRPLGSGGRLGRLYTRERAARAAGAAVTGARGGGRARHAIVAEGSGRWTSFAARLATARRRGLAALGEDGVRAFAAEYRDAAADLARLNTAMAGRDSDESFRLGRLVSEGHNLLYRRETNAPRAAARYLARTLPREVRRAWRPIALSALLLFGPMLTSAVAVARRPALASEFMPRAMIRRAAESTGRARDRSGYIADPEAARPLMASMIIANNVQVTYLAFAAGVTAGVGTVLALVFNGVEIGGMFGLYHSAGTFPLLMAFVAPHGVLELSAIAIGGGAGFLLAAGLLLPGARTRREAIVANARRAVHLVVFATLLLLVAGTLEGLVSPIPTWPLAAKLAVSAATALFLTLWLALGAERVTKNGKRQPL